MLGRMTASCCFTYALSVYCSGLNQKKVVLNYVKLHQHFNSHIGAVFHTGSGEISPKS